ncbi:MAG: Spy/CpxP family protein refolding chaperone [Alphaproteobacteria bacterium]
MSKFQTIRPNILLVTACIISFAIAQPPLALAADAITRSAHNEGDVAANSHDLVQGAHVEGHIAFLRAELGITSAQEPLWAPVAEAMREDVRNLQEAESKASQKQAPDDAVEYLENRVLFANLRAQGEARFLTAFRPLYGSLSQQQKQVADGLLIPSRPE